MKRLLTGALALILSLAASATTLNPVQLLNPAGSSSGQAIVSTGASTAPAWGTPAIPTNSVALTGLIQVGANVVLGNPSGVTANVGQIGMPSCSTSASALTWTAATGFTCNTAINAATLGGATFAAPGPIGTTTAAAGKFTTLQATGALTPSTTAGIVGTTLGDNANAGSVGELAINTTTNTSLTSNTTSNATSVALTAGDWDVQCSASFNPAGTTTVQVVQVGISTTSATLPGTAALTELAASFTSGSGQVIHSPVVTENLSASTTVYCPVQATFGVSTMTVNGFIRARRIR